MCRIFKIMLIVGVIVVSGGVIYMVGEVLWDKDNVVGLLVSVLFLLLVLVVKVFSCIFVFMVEFIGFLVVLEIVELCLCVGGIFDVVSVLEGCLVSCG